MSFKQYIHGFYDDIINPPFENKHIQKKWLICDKNWLKNRQCFSRDSA